MLAENSFDNISSGVSRLQGDGKNLAAGCLYFFPPGDKVRPIGALDQHIGQNESNQLARGFFVKQCDRIDRFQRQRHLGAFRLGYKWPGWPLHPLYAGIRIQREDQNIAHRPCLFEQPDMARMEQIVAAVSEDHRSPFPFPESPLFSQLCPAIESSHERPVYQP